MSTTRSSPIESIEQRGAVSRHCSTAASPGGFQLAQIASILATLAPSMSVAAGFPDSVSMIAWILVAVMTS